LSGEGVRLLGDDHRESLHGKKMETKDTADGVLGVPGTAGHIEKRDMLTTEKTPFQKKKGAHSNKGKVIARFLDKTNSIGKGGAN